MALLDVVFRILKQDGSGFLDPAREAKQLPDNHNVVVSNIASAPVGLTNAQLRAADVNVADSGERQYLHKTADVSASGDTTLHTPAAGKFIRLHWVYAINDPVAAASTKLKFRFGSNAPIYNVWALSKRQLKDGAVNEPLILNLSAAGNVAVTFIYEEV